MRFPVPQFINIEDKVAGPLTWKQLYWMIGMGILLLLFWKALPGIYFALIGLPIAVGFLAMAFWKPWGQPLSKVLWHFMIFTFRPKSYFWQRVPEEDVSVVEPNVKEKKRAEMPSYEETTSRIRNFADILDNPEKAERYEEMNETDSKKSAGLFERILRKNRGK
jgi:hypothetical protein